MGGVGSFNRDNRTLYVGGLKTNLPGVNLEELIIKHFAEWGDLEYGTLATLHDDTRRAERMRT
jgi:hypothetical protein